MGASHTLCIINILIYTTTTGVRGNVTIDAWLETKLSASVMLLQVRHTIFALFYCADMMWRLGDAAQTELGEHQTGQPTTTQLNRGK
jgi:hypothetical protein